MTLWQPAHTATALAAGMVVVGFVLLAVTARQVAGLDDVALQVPYALSGGVSALALVGAGAALLNVQAARVAAARERQALDALLRDCGGLLEALTAGPVTAPRPAPSAALVVVGASAYHRPGCRAAARLSAPRVVPPDVAAAEGLSACRVCRPPAPSR